VFFTLGYFRSERGDVGSRGLLAAVPGRWGPAFSLAVRTALQLQSPGGVGAIGGRAAARFVCSLSSDGLAAQRGPGSLPQLHAHLRYLLATLAWCNRARCTCCCCACLLPRTVRPCANDKAQGR
jgi:hypothetical protein